MDLALVLHGDATKAALTNKSFALRTGEAGTNPNLSLLRELKQAGVKVYVCAQALAHHQFPPDEVAEPVTVAASAATVTVDRQMAGYAYVPFH
jgi:intracellular sulfur oxidation DsrE/DsrF family protein